MIVLFSIYLLFVVTFLLSCNSKTSTSSQTITETEHTPMSGLKELKLRKNKHEKVKIIKPPKPKSAQTPKTSKKGTVSTQKSSKVGKVSAGEIPTKYSIVVEKTAGSESKKIHNEEKKKRKSIMSLNKKLSDATADKAVKKSFSDENDRIPGTGPNKALDDWQAHPPRRHESETEIDSSESEKKKAKSDIKKKFSSITATSK